MREKMNFNEACCVTVAFILALPVTIWILMSVLDEKCGGLKDGIKTKRN